MHNPGAHESTIYPEHVHQKKHYKKKGQYVAINFCNKYSSTWHINYRLFETKGHIFIRYALFTYFNQELTRASATEDSDDNIQHFNQFPDYEKTKTSDPIGLHTSHTTTSDS
eukprot:151911_1